MRKQSVFLRLKFHHLLFWLVIFGIWYFLRYQDYSLKSKALLITLVKVVDLALLIYLANYVLVPRLFYKKKYVAFATIFILMIAASSFIKMQIIGRILNSEGLTILTAENIKARIYDNFIPHFFLVVAGVAVKMMYDHTKMQRQLAELAMQKAEAELGFLKSQINPHFLFNSLNSVYFLIDKENDAARSALHKFSEMLRYQLYDLGDKKIPIEKEISFLKDYIDVQRLRKEKNYQINFTADTGVNNFDIEPLLLIPFVENAFKHISHYGDRENFINVKLVRQNGCMHFMVENSIESNNKKNQSGGIGLNNVARRLELIYPGKHKLKVENLGSLYRVELEITV